MNCSGDARAHAWLCAQSLGSRCICAGCEAVALVQRLGSGLQETFGLVFFRVWVSVWKEITQTAPAVEWSIPEAGARTHSQVLDASGLSCGFKLSEKFVSSNRRCCSLCAGDLPYVTPRHRSRALARSRISQYLGRDFNVTQVQILYVNFLVGSFSY